MNKKNKKKYENEILNILQNNKSGLTSSSLSKLLQIHKADYHSFRAAIERLKNKKEFDAIKIQKGFSS